VHSVGEGNRLGSGIAEIALWLLLQTNVRMSR
jgi:hypothetical protein